MSKIKIIHIDDEQQTLQYCKGIFKLCKELEYVQGFTNAQQAVSFLQDNKVDLIFCDIEMPEQNGLWLSQNLPHNLPIVFITAHTGFAVQAFEACALHYLIKPLTISQLNNVMDRFKVQSVNLESYKEQVKNFYSSFSSQKTEVTASNTSTATSTDTINKFFINNIGKIIIVNLKDLQYMEGMGNYTKFFMTNGDMHTSSKNLKVYDDAIVNHQDFVRIHRSFIINKHFVKQIVKGTNHQWFVEMMNTEKLEISKGRLDEILEKLQ